MIVVWDNGEEYEDHRTDFIDCGDVPVATAVEALSIAEKYGSVIAHVEPNHVRWQGGCSAWELPRFLENAYFGSVVYEQTQHDADEDVEMRIDGVSIAAIDLIETAVRAKKPYEQEEILSALAQARARRSAGAVS